MDVEVKGVVAERLVERLMSSHPVSEGYHASGSFELPCC